MPSKDHQVILNDLKKYYEKPGHPLAFSGVQKIWKYYDKKVPRKVIEKFLTQFDSFSLHRQKKKRKSRTPVFVRDLRHQLHIDLFYFHQQELYNAGIRYLLLAIDAF